MIRTIRPDVIVGFVFDGEGGGQHHQTSSRLTRAGVPRRGRSQRRSPIRFAGRPAAVAGEEVLLHRPASAARPAAGTGAARAKARRRCCMFTGGDDLRPAARPHLQRDRRRSAQHAQVPGHVAAAAAAGRVDDGFGSGPARLSPARHGAARRRQPRRSRDVRRRRHALAEPGRLRRRQRAGGARRARLERIAAASPTRAPPCREGSAARPSRRSPRGLDGRARRCARGSPRMGLADDGAYEIDVRLDAEGHAVRARRCVLAADVRLDAVANDGLVVRRPAGAGADCSPPTAATRRSRSAAHADAASRPRHAATATRRAAAPKAVAQLPPHGDACRPTRGSPPRTSSTPPTPRASCSTPTCRPACRSVRRRSWRPFALTIGGQRP